MERSPQEDPRTIYSEQDRDETLRLVDANVMREDRKIAQAIEQQEAKEKKKSLWRRAKALGMVAMLGLGLKYGAGSGKEAEPKQPLPDNPQTVEQVDETESKLDQEIKQLEDKKRYIIETYGSSGDTSKIDQMLGNLYNKRDQLQNPNRIVLEDGREIEINHEELSQDQNE